MSTALKHAVVAEWFCLLALVAPNAHSDVVTQWNETADATSATAGGPPIRARITAMTQIAVHDALNAIDRRFEPYTPMEPAAPGASVEAAVAAAAYRVLAATVPGQAGTLAILYANRVSGIADCADAFPTCIEDGIATGE